MSVEDIQELDKGDVSQNMTASSAENYSKEQEELNVERKPCFISPKQTILKMNDITNDSVPVYFVHCQGRNIWVAKWLALLTSDLEVLGSNTAGGRIQLMHYEGHAKSSVTNRLPWFYPRYILKCFSALEWCVK